MITRHMFRNPKWNDRVDAVVSAQEQVDLAKTELQRLRVLTNWHQLAPGAKRSLVSVRAHLVAALNEVDAALVED